jgi:hypothetical protein
MDREMLMVRWRRKGVVVRESPPGGGPVCGVLKLGKGRAAGESPHGSDEEDVSRRRRRGERDWWLRDQARRGREGLRSAPTRQSTAVRGGAGVGGVEIARRKEEGRLG